MTTDVEAALAHFGKKGMKWGIRKEKAAAGNKRAQRQISRADNNFSRKANSGIVTINIYNEAVPHINRRVGEINNKPQYKNADLTRDTPQRRRYYKDVQHAFIGELEKAANTRVSKTGNKKLGINEHADGSWNVIVRDIQHADDDNVLTNVKLVFNDSGHIVGFKFTTPNPDLLQSDEDVVDEFLEHFGVKGMHWGVRRREKKRAESSDEANAASDAKTKIKKAGGTHALTNKELQELVTRLNLEKQFKQLAPSKQKVAAKFVGEILLNAGKQQAQKMAQDQLAKQVASLLGK